VGRNNHGVRTDDTIAAVATAPGRSARAIVRVSGPGTDGGLRTLTGDGLGDRGARPGRLRLRSTGRLATPDTLTLPVAVLAFPGPASYTGEDSAEILLPGNPLLAARVLEAVLEAGARQAAGPSATGSFPGTA